MHVGPDGGPMTAVEQPADVVARPGWFRDPYEQHDLRYFDGGDWTDHVTHHGPEPCTGCHGAGAPDAA